VIKILCNLQNANTALLLRAAVFRSHTVGGIIHALGEMYTTGWKIEVINKEKVVVDSILFLYTWEKYFIVFLCLTQKGIIIGWWMVFHYPIN